MAYLFLIPFFLYLIGAWLSENKSKLEILSKSLATAVLTFLFWLYHKEGMGEFQTSIFLGLIFCFLGDVILSINNHVKKEMLNLILLGFGLAGFMTGYLFYGFRFFFTGEETLFTAFFFTTLTIFTLFCYSKFSNLDKPMKIPVLLYCFQAILLVTGAFRMVLTFPEIGTFLILLSAISIYTSDMIIGFNLFRNPLKHADYWIMAPYAVGHPLLVFSVVYLLPQGI